MQGVRRAPAFSQLSAQASTPLTWTCCAMLRCAVQMLLSSPHRTMDPEEADLFFVPAYVACLAWPVLGSADYPWWYSAGAVAMAQGEAT
jgi:hypothetical protein